MPERARPRGPAAAGNELTLIRVRTGMRIEVLLAQPPHFRQPGIVFPPGRQSSGALSNCDSQQRPQRAAEPVQPFANGRRDPVVGEAAVAFFGHEPRVLQKAEVARDARLRDPQDPGQLAHVQPLGLQQPQHSQTSLVPEQAEEGWSIHIYKSILMDARWQFPISQRATPKGELAGS